MAQNKGPDCKQKEGLCQKVPDQLVRSLWAKHSEGASLFAASKTATQITTHATEAKIVGW